MNKGKPAKIWLKNPKQNGQKRGKKRKLRKMPKKNAHYRPTAETPPNINWVSQIITLTEFAR